MTNEISVKELDHLESLLEHANSDFSAAYITVQGLHTLVRSHPEIIRPKTVSVLQHLLKNSKYASQKMSFFLYKETAETLISILVHTPEAHLADQALTALRHIISTISGIQQRAAAEALGALPLVIHSPAVDSELHSNLSQASWQEILVAQGIDPCDAPQLIGRSIVVKHHKESHVLVVKTANSDDDLNLLNREAQWMEALKVGGYSFPVRFDIPRPIKIGESFVFRLQDPPHIFPKAKLANQQHCYAIGFIAHEDYFCYPNNQQNNRRLTPEDFREVLFRNAWLLGKLTAWGIVHSAPIPLFHNRIQQTRRTDYGLYEWPRSGRLDRWLHTCRYPNFGLTGLRDFEHLVTAKESDNIYRQIGTHLLSLLLVAGSYFRNQDADRYGLDGCGEPVDTRNLFDKSFFKQLIEGVFLNYYHGFVQEIFQGKIPVDFDEFVPRLIDAMGVDRHMEEILRVFDQSQMTEQEFRTFLEQNGLSCEEIARLEKGRRDITLQTGPHLGGFNQRISIPELIDFLSATSAFCVAGKYDHQQRAYGG